ncbi:MAG: hypothetical protein WDO69_10035 [Pseudomonadota bacterium]
MANERCKRIPSRPLLLGGLAVGALLTLSGSARAAEPAVWYLASENCPDGASFLQRLEQRGVRAHLAQAGDQVDFVVRLGTNDEGSSGRLERQTSGGTIAIREVAGVKCEPVAEVLALTLALTLDPASQSAPAPSTATTTAAPPSAAVPAEVAPAAAPPTPRTPNPAPVERAATFSMGAEASAWDIFEGAWLLAAGLFGELEAPASFALPRASLRGVLRGGLAPNGHADSKVWLAAGRIEGCPVGFDFGRLDLRPCAGLDVGAIGASAAGVSDVAGWLAFALHARASIAFNSFALEAQVGAVLPITRYEVATTRAAETLEATKIIGFTGGLGVRFPLQ